MQARSTRGSGEETTATTPGAQRAGWTSSPVCDAASAPPDDADARTRRGSCGPSEAEPLLATEEKEERWGRGSEMGRNAEEGWSAGPRRRRGHGSHPTSCGAAAVGWAKEMTAVGRKTHRGGRTAARGGGRDPEQERRGSELPRPDPARPSTLSLVDQDGLRTDSG